MNETREWKAPLHCPICGYECDVGEEADPERLVCPKHGLIDVECYSVEVRL